MPSVRQTISDFRTRLADRYPATETDVFIRILFSEYFGMSPADIHLQPDRELSAADQERISSAVDALQRYCPIQYIVGETEFYGLRFKVTPDVLIPRPETEELTDWIVKERASTNPKILDIGAGSGCIAVSLAVNIPHAEVWAMDVSERALAIAKNNADFNEASVRFVNGDILSTDATELFPEAYFDIIVSNPPYVAPAEKPLMQANVTEYEPHLALFPPGDDPLIFYKCIAAFGQIRLKTGGNLFFEINEAYPEETATILQRFGYSDVTVRKDINGKYRMAFGRKV